MMKFILFIFFFCIVVFSSIAQKDTLNDRHISPKVLTFSVEPDVEIAVTDWGGQGLPLLFIPSWTATAHVFDDFAPRFRDNYRVFVLDLRGHGNSSRPSHGYNIDVLTTDILNVLDSLNIDSATLLGLSRSASLISHFAAKYPDRVNKLIYLSGPIDREFNRDYYSRSEIRELISQYRALTDSIRRNCPNISEKEITNSSSSDNSLPSNAFDVRPDTIGRNWRNNDPKPPYKKILVPALAFWNEPPSTDELYKRFCDYIPPDDNIIQILSRITEFLKIPHRHNRELYNNEMKNGKSFVIPSANYYTYVSHPALVENQIREFLEK